MTARLALGVDIGATQTRVGVIDASGQVVGRAAAPTERRPSANVERVERLAEEAGFRRLSRAVDAVGICSPGPLDLDAGIVIDIPTLPDWRGFALRAAIGDAFGLPAVLEGDGVAAAFGEWRFGAGRGMSDLVYVTVSTGIGGGVIADGSVLRGRRGLAGHVGHMIIAERGARCSCGAIGCFEALASGSAFAAAARSAGLADAPAAVAAARAGEARALTLVAEEARLLARGFATLAHLFSPERIIVGGGVSQAFDLLGPRVRASMRELLMPAFSDVEVVAAALGDNAGLIGAAALAREAAGTG